MKTIHVGLLSLALLPAGAVLARAEGKTRIFLNGTFAPTSLDFSESRKFTEFVEEGTIDSKYKADTGPGVELGLQYNFAKHVGAVASFYLSKRDGSATFTAALPHPLYLGKPRSASGDVKDLSYKENAGLLALVLTGSSGSLDFGAFAGGALFKVESDLIREIQYSHTYPYDSVTVTGVPKASSSDSPFGFNLGASLDYHLGRRFGLGAQARYCRAKAKLVPSQGSTVEIDAGGFQLAAGVRVFF